MLAPLYIPPYLYKISASSELLPINYVPMYADKGRNRHRKYPAETPWFERTLLNYTVLNFATLLFHCSALQSLVLQKTKKIMQYWFLKKTYCTVDIGHCPVLEVPLFCMHFINCTVLYRDCSAPYIQAALSMWGQYSIKVQWNYSTVQYSTFSIT